MAKSHRGPRRRSRFPAAVFLVAAGALLALAALAAWTVPDAVEQRRAAVRLCDDNASACSTAIEGELYFETRHRKGPDDWSLVDAHGRFWRFSTWSWFEEGSPGEARVYEGDVVLVREVGGAWKEPYGAGRPRAVNWASVLLAALCGAGLCVRHVRSVLVSDGSLWARGPWSPTRFDIGLGTGVAVAGFTWLCSGMGLWWWLSPIIGLVAAGSVGIPIIRQLTREGSAAEPNGA